PPRSATPRPAAVVFAPGEIVGERYRIAGLLGRGGMGEVYRADDLKLGQAVALKFLPRALADDPAARERFHGEVRLARQVSHPHVCRVYDIGELDGRPFLSMEYVDGEDLATLLRRIGRLPPVKAVEIARQLCAGLAAAHEKGVLHRDLKPANVMVDGHGRARITDFGLAVGGDDAPGGFAGTPAYMAPERLAGGPATVRSDVYELGLVLYELFTGKRPFEAERPASRPLTHPSTHTSDMDPAAERAILRCLELQPEKRPRSVAEVALALPGGDPLAAAVAAGETPSPEMVAAAGGEGALPRKTAWMLLLLLLAVVGAIIAVVPASSDLGVAPMQAGPEVLEHRARELADRFAGPQQGGDSAAWMERNYTLIRWLADHLDSTDWRRRLASLGTPALFHLRRSPEALVPGNVGSVVADNNPPEDVPGMVRVVLTERGRLVQLRVVAPRWDAPPAGTPATPPWDALFQEAMLDPARFTEVPPSWRPPVPYDQRREWKGTIAEFPELDLRVSAATLGGRAVYFSILGPWDAPTAVNPLTTGIGPRVRAVTLGGMIVALVVVLPFFTRRNLRLGRADRRGAGRVAATIAVLGILAWVGVSHLSISGALVPTLGGALTIAAAAGLFAWTGYMTIEPYLRRQTPELLIGWARVLEGRFTDPRVGRDVLGGMLLGATGAAIVHLVNGLPTWWSFSGQTTMPHLASLAVGRLNAVGALCQLPATAVIRGLSFACIAFLLRLLLKRPAFVFAGMWLLGAALAWGAENVALEAPGSIVVGLMLAIAVTRLGLLATVASVATGLLLQNFPLIFTSPWFTPYALIALALVVGTGIWAFRVSLGGQPAFGGSLDG
ncbi:MAG TPA: serine/threonine-protein kinase, partial [Candidatus Polarisedimenticolaceae bacterium]|nr:serine/threonine-protein kinase [Candidatus Polarisedimenticolaceae bacterium]